MVAKNPTYRTSNKRMVIKEIVIKKDKHFKTMATFLQWKVDCNFLENGNRKQIK